MPELLIMRHAKSDWGVDLSGDRERPLAKRGVKDARCMGRLITKVDAVPELVLSSPAVRARTTAELAAKAGKWGVDVTIVPSFYGGIWADVAKGVLERASMAERVLVVGHEPTWSDLVSVLIGGGQVAMPTAGLACVAIPGNDWSKLEPNCGELQWHVTPRQAKAVL